MLLANPQIARVDLMSYQLNSQHVINLLNKMSEFGGPPKHIIVHKTKMALIIKAAYKQKLISWDEAYKRLYNLGFREKDLVI